MQYLTIIARRIYIILAIVLLLSIHTFAQLSGIKSIPGDYTTISAAVTALNAAGVGAGGVTFNVAANYTETISATISLTATGTSSNPITFQKDPLTTGADPLITAYTGGVGTPGTAVQDGIWRLIGSDYVTINGIDLHDNPANTTNPSTMEYGFALYKTSASNGCQNVTIENCTITLNNINNTTGVGVMTDGSAGIIVMNATAIAATTALTTTAGGTNSNNKFYSNTIQDCNIGISIIGYAAASPFTLADTNNDIGGTSSSTGNTIINYGGAAGAANPAAAIRTLAQYGLNVSYNTINSNNGGGANHPNALRGIYINAATSASITVTHNTITLAGGGTTQYIAGIENIAGSTPASNTINISNNTVTNCTYSTATTGGFYGILNNGASPATLTLNNNIISNNSSAATGAGFFYGIANAGVASSVTMSNNIFTGNSTAALTTGLFLGMYNSAATPSLNINSNTLSGNSTTALSGAYYPIYNAGAATTTININSNNIGTSLSPAITFNAANSGTQYAIINTKGAATAALSISNNTIQGYIYSVVSTGSNTYISNSAATLSQTINNNVFANLSVNITGSVVFITDNVIVPSTGFQNINNNAISGTFSKTASTGSITLFTSGSTCPAGSVINNNNNNFSNITVTGTTTIAGWVNTDAGSSTKTIQDNTFYNWVGGTGAITAMSVSITAAGNVVSGNTISNITNASTITGISVGAGNNNVYGNTIDSLTSTGATAVSGISIIAGANNSVYKNKIYDLQASVVGGTVNGIVVSGTTVVTTNIYNNVIGNLRTPASSAADPIRGISIAATAVNSTINVYYNTVYLNATSTGVNFGTSGIYHIASATSTTAVLNLINNIVDNVSTPNGTGLIVAFRSSTTALNNYGSTSDANLFYSGAPAANKLIFYDGTVSYQTLSSYLAHVSTRDINTVTEDIASKFLSTVGSSSSFLHLDPTKSTLAESGGDAINNYTIDIDGDTRYGATGYAGTGSAPDIGADEFDGTQASSLSGSYNVGAGQTYTSLTGAGGFFAAVNSLGLAGNITANITSDLTEDGSNSLYKWVETGAGNYTITIKPDASTPRDISGSVVGGLIHFNNASRVTIDGSNGTSTNYLSFENLDASGSTGTAFTFINGAANNTIKYCNVEAYANATNGVILFGTSTVGGNSNNTISNCNIIATVNSSTGNVAIYSGGTVANENSSNTISNNNIYNYRDRGIDISATGSNAWVISGNNLYNGDVSGPINYAAGSLLHGIRVQGGSGYSILNNYIGGNAASATGTAAVYSSTAGILSYQGILLTTTSATPASYIKGNTVANISVSAVPTATSANVFIGIEADGFGINVGGTLTGDGNIIGSNTTNSSITVTTTTAATTKKSIIIGINCQDNGGTVTGNQVGSFDIKNIGTAPAPSTFTGISINNATPPSQVTNNIIGSTGTGAAINSIRVLSSSTATTTALYGISIGALVASTIQVSGNTIQNMSQQSATASGTFTGISNSAISPAVITITGNTITGNANNATTGTIYCIYSNSSPSSLAITNNIVSNDTSTATTSGLFYGIYTTGTPSSIAINNNTFSGNVTATLTTGLFLGICNAGNPATLNINNNSLYGNSTTAASGVYYPIYNIGAVTTTININNNSIGNSLSNAITFNAANSGAQVFINNTAGAATAALSISNNNIQGVNYATAGTGGNTYISNSAATLSQAINGNTFTNLSLNTSGSVTFISDNVVVSATGTQNVNNNSISGTFKKTVAGGTITLFTSSASSVAGSVINNSNNNFSNITVTGATTIAGWVNTDAGSSIKTIQNNVFSYWAGGTSAITAMSVNLTGTGNATAGNLISNISSAGAITGILTAAGNDNIYSNTIDTLSSTGASAVTAISISAGTTKNIYKNKIYDISGSNAGSSINGILVAGGTTVNIYNNIIGNLGATAANSTIDLIRGISVTSTTVLSAINVSFNTIYINAASTGTNFNTSGIYHVISATATTAALTLRSNVIFNTSTPKGTGLTVAYRRSGTTLTNYGSASNNNLLYAGTVGATRLIFYDGTNSCQTLSSFQTRVSTRDVNSVTQDLSTIFLSTTGSSSLFLHINPALSTVIESGGVNITGITDDFDGQVRAGNTGYTGTSTSPDIGADEIFGLETTPPTITYTLLSNTTSTSNLNVTGITITDASGVNTVAGTKPRIYYKRSTDANALLDNTSSTNGWKYTEATNSSTPYTFTINYSLLYGGSSVTAGAIQYFITAQDMATVPNVGINSGTFAATPSSVALTSTAFPISGTVNAYNIPFSGSYNVGSTEVFTSLTKSNGLFAAINSVGLMGNTTINITSDLAEDGTNALNQWVESGAGNYTLTIQPDAATLRTVSGNVSNGLIRFNGADRVTVNGSNSGSGSYLSFKNTNTAGTVGTAFTFINGATYDSIKYCDAEAYANATNGVILFSTSSVTGGNSNDVIDNCTINATLNGNTGNVAIYSAGTVGNENSSNTISNNAIYNYMDRALDITSTGSTGWTVYNNNFYNGSVSGAINYAASSALHGIRILGGSGYSILNNYIGGNTLAASGTNASYASTLGDLSYEGIVLTTSSASPASYIKSNTIASISLSSVPTAANSNTFTGIETNGYGINIGGTSAGDGNTIGSAGSNSSLKVTTTTTSTTNTSLIKGINCASSGSLIYNNQVSGLDIANMGTAPAASYFQGIYINNASASTQVNNNIIGSETMLTNIRVLPSSSATTTSITGIAIGSLVNSAVQVANNVIENLGNLSSTSSGSFTGISNSALPGASVTISTDTIENISTVSNVNSGSSVYSGITSASPATINNNTISSITLLSTGTNAQIIGINVSGGANTISNNFISTLSTASSLVTTSVETASPALSAVIGILDASASGLQNIFGNTLYQLGSTANTALNTLVTGIGITSSASGNIYDNRIRSFTNTATGAASGICGITAYNGLFNVYNNALKITNSSNTNALLVYGINHAASTNWNYYFNSISIGGTSTGTAIRSSAFIRSVSGTMSLRNNIFLNKRAGTGSNFAISNIPATPAANWASSTSDYNNLYGSDTTKVAEWGVAVNKTYSQWQAISGGDAHSANRLVNFLTSTFDLAPDTTTNCAISNSATPITSPVSITSDINGITRNSVTPDMGAYEFNYVGFTVIAGNSSPVCSGSTISFTADPGAAVSPSYSWKNANHVIVATTQNPNISTSISGNYILMVTDANGCSDSASTIVSLNARPSAILSGTATICNGSSANLIITVAGNGTISGNLSNGDAFSGTAPSITVAESPATTTTYGLAVMSDSFCVSQSGDLADSVIITVSNGIWTGASGTDWNNVNNWCGNMPTDSTDAIISSGLTNYPVVGATDSVHNVKISSGALLTISPSGLLAIYGAIADSGTLANNGGILLNGTVSQNFPGSNGTLNGMNNLTVNNPAGVTIDKSFVLTGTLTPNLGAINLGNQNITLYSNYTNTAQVAAVGGSFVYSGTGRFIVQRYFPPRRAWRLLTAPLTSSSTIFNSWQNNGVYATGKGTFITGPSANVTNGLDTSIQNNSSMKYFNVSTQALLSVTNTNVNVSPGNSGSADNAGYFVFIRGDRNTNNLFLGGVNSTTISCAGKLQTGPQVFTASSVAGKYTLIGNPYASPIDFNNITRNNIIKRFYVWDPELNLNGAYVVLDDVDDDGVFVSSVIGSAQDKNIQSQQAFFVQTTSNGPASITFNESSKSPVNNNLVFRPTSSMPSVNVQLYLVDSAITLADGTMAQYSNQFSGSVTTEDAKKLTNTNENIYLLRSGVKLAIERRPVINQYDTLFINLSNTAQRNYRFVIDPENMDLGNVGAFLIDNYLNSQTPLPLTGNTTVNFTINADAASQNAGRFSIVFRPQTVVPVTFTSIKASTQNDGINVSWNVQNQVGIKQYIVEKSTDNINFTKVATVASNTNAAGIYNWIDVSPQTGNNYYRVLSIDNTGQTAYSKVVQVNIQAAGPLAAIYQNPVTNGVMGLQLNNMPAGVYQLRLLNTVRQQVQANSIYHTGGNALKQIILNKNLAKGVYYLELIDENKKAIVLQVSIN